MERVSFIEYKGKCILLEDFSRMSPGKEFSRTIAKAQSIIASEPLHSVLSLFDGSHSSLNDEMIEQVKQFTKANAPYIKAVATVGLDGLLQFALFAAEKYTGREFPTFRTREEALEFLVSVD